MDHHGRNGKNGQKTRQASVKRNQKEQADLSAGCPGRNFPGVLRSADPVNPAQYVRDLLIVISRAVRIRFPVQESEDPHFLKIRQPERESGGSPGKRQDDPDEDQSQDRLFSFYGEPAFCGRQKKHPAADQEKLDRRGQGWNAGPRKSCRKEQEADALYQSRISGLPILIQDSPIERHKEIHGQDRPPVHAVHRVRKLCHIEKDPGGIQDKKRLRVFSDQAVIQKADPQHEAEADPHEQTLPPKGNAADSQVSGRALDGKPAQGEQNRHRRHFPVHARPVDAVELHAHRHGVSHLLHRFRKRLLRLHPFRLVCLCLVGNMRLHLPDHILSGSFAADLVRKKLYKFFFSFHNCNLPPCLSVSRRSAHSQRPTRIPATLLSCPLNIFSLRL